MNEGKARTGLTRGSIRVGIGGWTYAPWRGLFYPEGLPQTRELKYASRQVTAIEVNGTFYRAQKPESFAKWRDETPEDFIFSVKAPGAATMRRVLAEAGPPIERFIASGLAELRTKLGPILWQFAPTKRFDAADMAAFLKLLPRKVGTRRVRHVLEPRHESFLDDAFVELARRHDCAIVFTDSEEYPQFTAVTSDFVYLRLVRSQAHVRTGYPAAALSRWARIAQTHAGGDESRDVFVFFIDGAKERAPAAACALLSRVQRS